MKHFAVLAAVAYLSACAGPLVKPAAAPQGARGGTISPRVETRDALLILPGFGYGRDAGKTFKALAATAARDGIDVYLPPFITRSGLEGSRTKLERFIREQRLDRYERLHVFAFIAGAWTLNPLLDRLELPNLTTIVYDRSPYQERAPKIATTKLRRRAWLRYGQTIFDVARTPYPPLAAGTANVALLVESSPTPFVMKHAAHADAYGPFTFGCDSLGQRYDDCAYLPMNHEDLYARFAEVWPELRAFILTGQFSAEANRTPPPDGPLTTVRR